MAATPESPRRSTSSRHVCTGAAPGGGRQLAVKLGIEATPELGLADRLVFELGVAEWRLVAGIELAEDHAGATPRSTR